MKRTAYTTILLLAALLMGACSDVLTPAQELAADVQSDSVGWVRVCVAALSDGSDPATRAADYQNGDEEDYRINKVVLLLFKGTDAKSASFHSVYSLLNGRNGIAEGDTTAVSSHATVPMITQSYSKAFAIVNPTLGEGEKFWAYAMVNRDALTLLGNNKLLLSDLLGNPKQIDSSWTFEAFSKLVLNGPGGRGNMLMTNAPMVTATGTSATIHYMPSFDTNSIYTSKEMAKAKPAMEVYVERVLCKVTVKDNDGTEHLTGKLDLSPSVEYDVSNIRWSTDNRNMAFYNMRQIEGAMGTDGYLTQAASSHPAVRRFVDATPSVTTANSTNLYRVFWAEDINYTFPDRTSKNDENLQETHEGMQMGPNITQVIFQGDTLFNFDNPLGGSDFCRENTVSAEFLTQDKTTRVYVRVPFYTGLDASGQKVEYEGFYTLPASDEPDKIYHKDGTRVRTADQNLMRTYLMNYIVNLDEYKTWKATYAPTASDDDIIKLTILNEDSYLKTHKDNKDPIVQVKGNFFTGMDNDGNPIRPDNQERRLLKIEGMEDFSAEDKARLYTYEGDQYLVQGETYDLNQDGRIYYDENNDGKNDVAERILPPAFGFAEVLVRYNPSVVTDAAAQAAFRDLSLTNLINQTMKINYYPLGFAYYPVRIRHFSDDEVNDFVPQRTAYTDVYPGTPAQRQQNYLGRYGVVRNTWYIISLEGINHIGWSTGYDPDPVPDDDSDSYMGAHIYINRWAKRAQEEVLE